MASIIDAIPTHQPGSRNYAVMTAVSYFGGLRPSETAMLRPRVLHQPAGWGSIDVVEADDGYDEPAEPKTGERTVPIPPALVEILRAWLAEHDFAAHDLLFRTEQGDARHRRTGTERSSVQPVPRDTPGRCTPTTPATPAPPPGSEPVSPSAKQPEG